MKLFLKFGLAIACGVMLALYLVGCVKITGPDAPPVDLRSTTRIVNLANFGPSITANIDGSILPSVAYGGASAYQDLPAGRRFFTCTYASHADTFHMVLPTNTKATLFCAYDAANGDADCTYVLAYERLTYAGSVSVVPGSVLVRFLNLTNDTASTSPLGVQFDVLEGPNANVITFDTLKSGIKFGGITSYYQAPLSQFPRYLLLSGRTDTLGNFIDTLVHPTSVATAAGRYSIVVYGSRSASTLQTQVLKED